jgi:hypothetical protein
MSVFAGTNWPPNWPPNGGTFVELGLNDAIHRRGKCRARPRAWPVNVDAFGWYISGQPIRNYCPEIAPEFLVLARAGKVADPN